MARRKLPSTSARIFNRKPSLSSRLLSAGLLTLSLLVMLAGIGTAVYLDRPRAPTATTAPPQAAEAAALAQAPSATPPAPPVASADATIVPPPPPAPESPPPQATVAPPPALAMAPPASPAAPLPPVAAAESPPAASLAEAPAAAEAPPPITAPEPDSAAALAAVEPQAGPSAAPDEQKTDRPAPAEAAAPPKPAPSEPASSEEPERPAAATVKPEAQFWVEYAVYVGKFYARKLHVKLAAQGLDTVVVRTHTPAGRPLWRVRSGFLGRAAARAAASKAHRALKIVPLIHRVHRASPAKPGPIESVSASPRGYWVQYGAFAHRQNAQRLGHKLNRHGLHAHLYVRRGTSGKPLYLVRSPGLPNRASAVALVQRYKPIAVASVLIGHSLHWHSLDESASSRRAPAEDQKPAFRHTG